MKPNKTLTAAPVSLNGESEMFDEMCKQRIENCPGVSVAWLLMASYCYYHLDQPLLSDGCYDGIAAFIRENWADVSHPDKRLLSREGLGRTSSLFELTEGDYPLRTRSAANTLLKTDCSSLQALNAEFCNELKRQLTTL